MCLGLAAAAPAQAPPGGTTIILAEMDQRDWLNSLTTTNSFRAPNPNPAVEWDMTEEGETVSHAAYVKGSGVTVKIRLANKTGNRVAGSFTIQGARLKVPGPSAVDPGPYYVSLSASPSSFSFSLAPTTKFSQEITISGLPNHVAVGAFEVKYTIQAAEYSPDDEILRTSTIGTNGTFQAWERICILDATPIGYLIDDNDPTTESPWEHGIWTDFLEYTCRWAYGASGPAQVKEWMTKGMFLSRYTPKNWLYYDPSSNWYWNTPINSAESSILDLPGFLSDLGDPLSMDEAFARLDCRDFAGILCLALSCHGAPSACARFHEGSFSPFTTWPLCPAGADPSLVGPAYYWTPTVSSTTCHHPSIFM